MKKYFKGILASLLVLAFVLGLGACGKKSETKDETTKAQTETTTVAQTEAPAKVSYIGTWKLTGAEAGGVVINDFSQLSQMMGEEMNMSITLNEDGSASATFNGDTKDGAKWEEKDGNIVLSGMDSSDALTLKIEESTLSFEEESDGMKVKLIFTKQ